MWSFMSRMGCSEPKFVKGGCQGLHTLIGHPLPSFSDKQFPYLKSTNLTVQTYTTKTPEPKVEPPVNNPCNSSGKKKKKRRRRRRKKRPQRQRQISVAESEDSFVIFFDGGQCEETTDFDSCDSLVPQKKVRFPDDSRMCEVHPMIMWSYAYQAARKGPWEEYARDRNRFNKRVRDTEATIGHVFDSKHRAKIYEERFASGH